MTSKNSLPHWYPDKPPLYDIEKTYLENATHGPFFSGKIPERVFLRRKVDRFLGIQDRFVRRTRRPASQQTGSNSSGSGFDVVSTKPSAAKKHPAHPLPNMITSIRMEM
jgi:hypothetical protein